MDNFSGSNAAHVKLLYPGAGKTDSHSHSINGKSTWIQLPNENFAGDEPYALSFPETAKS
jgi:hypothetical protein